MMMRMIVLSIVIALATGCQTAASVKTCVAGCNTSAEVRLAG